jgi:hypothetical protein
MYDETGSAAGLIAFLNQTMKANPDYIKDRLTGAALALALTTPECRSRDALRDRLLLDIEDAIDVALGQLAEFEK